MPPLPPVPVSGQLTEAQLKEQQGIADNSYFKGLGYYHAVHHGWFPYPFNWHSPGFGYYWNGRWNSSSYSGERIAVSQPSPAAAAAAYSVVSRAHEDDLQRSSGSSGLAARSFTPAASRFSGGTAGPASSLNHSSSGVLNSGAISRGGFGSSGHGSSGT